MKETRGYGRGRIFRKPGCKTWTLRYYRHGKEIEEASGTRIKQDAQRALNARLGEMVSGHFVGPQADKVTVADLVQMVRDDHTLKQRRGGPAPLKRILEYFGADERALDIAPERMTAYALLRMKGDPSRGWRKVSPKTVCNEIGALHRGFVLAYRAGKLARVPYFEKPFVGDNARKGFVGDAELARLIPCLPMYLRPFVEVAYRTSWRRGELRNLRWSAVDFEAGEMRLEPGETKNGRGRSYPFGDDPRLVQILREQRAATAEWEMRTGQRCDLVFHRNGRPVGDYRDAVHTARVKAGLPDFLVHDLRRSAVRNLTRAGIPEAVAMSLSGHLTRSVFDRYNITSGEDQREAVRKIAARHPGVEEPEPKVVAMVSRGRGVE